MTQIIEQMLTGLLFDEEIAEAIVSLRLSRGMSPQKNVLLLES